MQGFGMHVTCIYFSLLLATLATLASIILVALTTG